MKTIIVVATIAIASGLAAWIMPESQPSMPERNLASIYPDQQACIADNAARVAEFEAASKAVRDKDRRACAYAHSPSSPEFWYCDNRIGNLYAARSRRRMEIEASCKIFCEIKFAKTVSR